MDLSLLSVGLGAVTVIVLGVCEALKYAGVNTKYVPLIGLVIGLVASYLVPNVSLVEGLVAAISAMGLYSGVKASMEIGKVV